MGFFTSALPRLLAVFYHGLLNIKDVSSHITELGLLRSETLVMVYLGVYCCFAIARRFHLLL